MLLNYVLTKKKCVVEKSVQKSISDISHFKRGIVICPPSKIETRVPPSEPTIWPKLHLPWLNQGFRERCHWSKDKTLHLYSSAETTTGRWSKWPHRILDFRQSDPLVSSWGPWTPLVQLAGVPNFPHHHHHHPTLLYIYYILLTHQYQNKSKGPGQSRGSN